VIALDTSAIVAVALDEPEARLFGEAIATEPCLIGWPTVLERRSVLAAIPQGRGLKVLDRLLEAPRMTTVPFDRRGYEAAHLAFECFGIGRHKARLNFGDCMAYAVAKVHDVPLLYKGSDFSHTDIRPARP